MSEEREETFWVANEETSPEVLQFVKRQPNDAARVLFNLRQENTNQKNAIAHLSRCAARGVRRVASLTKRVDEERTEIKRCESTIAELRERLEKMGAKGTRIQKAKKGGAR